MRRRVSGRAWAAVWLLALAAGLVADGFYLASGPVATGDTDFHQFRDSTAAWMDGEPMYRPVPQGDRVVFNLNPPHFHLLVLPLVRVSAEAGFALWLAGSIAALLWVLWQLLPAWFERLREPLWPLVLLAWLFVTPMTGSVLATGAPVWIMLPALYLAWRAHRQGRLATAGALVGVAGSMKLFLLLLLPWFLLRGEWAALRAALVALVTSVALGVAVFGLDAYQGWVAAMQGSERWAWGQLNASLAALTTRAFTETPYWQPLSSDVPAGIVWAVAVAALLLVTALRIGTQRVDRGWPLLIATALLVNPLGWIYYLWWLLPFVLVAGAGRLTACGAALLTVPPWAVFAAQPSAPATVTLGAVYVWGLLCLWVSWLLPDPRLAWRPSADAEPREYSSSRGPLHS